jgi:tetratricopeptide (TPR) repeat protein
MIARRLTAVLIFLAMWFACSGPARGGETGEMEIEQLRARVATLEKKVAELEKAVSEGKEKISSATPKSIGQEKYRRRADMDKEKYSAEELKEAEELFQAAQKKWKTDEARKSLSILIEKFPESNRAGCAVLYLAQMAEGKEEEEYLETAILKYGDCFFADGVQVGAYARFFLAQCYLLEGEKKKAEQLIEEIREKYPDAVNHKGKLLLEKRETKK